VANHREPSLQQIARLHRAKQRPAPVAAALGEHMLHFFEHSVAKRQTKLTKIAESWMLLVPELLCEHCALEGLHRGTLTVVVDSSSHLYELRQLLLAGLEKQLMIACRSAGLRKISLRLGRWYRGDGHEKKLDFNPEGTDSPRRSRSTRR
jgi:hypothetical protein